MNKKIRKMLRKVERRGGIVLMPDFLPDDVAEQFLEQVLSCPDCCAANSSSIDLGIANDHSLVNRRTKDATGH